MRATGLFCLFVMVSASPVGAQDALNADAVPIASSAASVADSVTSSVKPDVVQEVVAEGRAAFGVGGVPGARRAAEAQALRNAVEKALGIYVSARSLTQNYVLVKDRVLTRADGFATLKEVLKEEVGTEEVRVTIRARVSLKPLAEQLKAMKLTRGFRLAVVSRGTKSEDAFGQSLQAALTNLQNRLAEAGFVVVENPQDADLLIRVTPNFGTTNTLPLDTAAGPMTMYSVDGSLSVQAVRIGTGEIVAAFSTRDKASHITLTTARSEIAKAGLNRVTPLLTEALMVLPAAHSRPMTLVVSRLKSATQVGKLEDMLERLNGVEKVTRRSFANGMATWEMDVLTEAAPQLARNLEEAGMLRPFQLTVVAENSAKITAVAGTTTAASKRLPSRP